MFENLATAYRVFFEGRKEPVFYGSLYPVHGEKDDDQWELFRYGRGLKGEKPYDKDCFGEYEDAYREDLRNLIKRVASAASQGARIGLVAIPSSTQGKVNTVTSIARQLLANNALGCDDLTSSLVRTKSKEKAHDGGSRAVAENVKTLAFRLPASAPTYDVIIVIDDILTSGRSFVAVDTVLRNAGFTGTIVNFAFTRTTSAEADAVFEQGVNGDAPVRRNAPIDALVLDLDQTLLDDPVLNDEFDRNPYEYLRTFGGKSFPYALYPHVAQLHSLDIPFAVLSNGGVKRIRAIVTRWKISEELFGKRLDQGELGGGELPHGVFGAPRVEQDGFRYSLSKPCPDGVEQAVRHLIPNEHQRVQARIVGLGNTLEDMLAYRAAGAEPVLALWGVPAWLRPLAQQSWGATRWFEDLDAFCAWCKNPVEPASASVSAAPVPVASALSDDELAALPSMSSLLNTWKAAGDADATAFTQAKMNAGKANAVLERGGYLTPLAEGARHVTEQGQELGIIEHLEKPRRPKPGQDMVPVIRYTKHAEGPIKRLILESIAS